ncbi:hypothetical protein EYZ11_009400 [Aspergillus tanneri]|uniref:Major facilitator superfamily (MFS) profile domain-containing protein n=1 Tax=Aspergillus tanneri TaxID=1220188 RepID=A0A4S3J865_9EURO|nr:hypothetical protein EYZ11_009400 [Aspergillus tanneri]
MYTLSTWYTKEQLTKRIAVFFFGMFGGSAVSPLLGAALLKLDGKGNLAGWQWIFLVEGILSIVVSICLLLFLKEKTRNKRQQTALSDDSPDQKEESNNLVNDNAHDEKISPKDPPRACFPHGVPL